LAFALGVFSWQLGSGQEGPAGGGAESKESKASPAPTGGEKAQKTKAAADKVEAGGEKGKAAKSDSPILAVNEKEKIKNDIRRLLQNSRMAQAKEKVEDAIKRGGLHPSNKDLLAFAHWAKAILEGNANDAGKCIEHFDLAVEAGWTNPFTFQYAALIPDGIRQSAEFTRRVEALTQKFEDAQAAKFQKQVQAGIAAAAASSEPLALPEAITANEPLRNALQGKPVLLVITRIYHDGFRKAVPVLKELYEKHQDRFPVVVLFYQNDDADEHRAKLTARYVGEEKLDPIPHAIVGRDFVRPLSLPIFPVFLFLDAQQRVAFRQDGLIHEKFITRFLEMAMQSVAATSPAPAPPKEEAPPKDETPPKDTAPPKEPPKKPAPAAEPPKEPDPAPKPVDAPKADPKAETPKPEEPKPEQPKPESSKPESPKPEEPQPAPEKEKDEAANGEGEAPKEAPPGDGS
jgi:hypothetical protein